MKDTENRPRISRWIGRGYALLFIFIVVIYTAIALWSGVFDFLYLGIFYSAVMTFALVLTGVTAYGLYKTAYKIKGGFLYSWSPFAVISLKLKDIKEIERTRIPFYFKGWGASLYSGRFYIPGVGWTRVIITNLTDGVLITDKTRRHYLITPSNPDGFVKLFRTGGSAAKTRG